MKTIPLDLGLHTSVDDDVYEWAANFRWRARRDGHTIYAIGPDKILLHRMIMSAKEGELVDHRDSNGLNNVRTNLRKATASQNAAHRRTQNPTKGVQWVAQKQKWLAIVVCKKRKYRCGHFAEKEDAVAAYDAKATELFGEFAYTNAMIKASGRLGRRIRQRVQKRQVVSKVIKTAARKAAPRN